MCDYCAKHKEFNRDRIGHRTYSLDVLQIPVLVEKNKLNSAMGFADAAKLLQGGQVSEDSPLFASLMAIVSGEIEGE